MARENLSDFIVVGRPIYKDNNPRKICEKIYKKFNNHYPCYVLIIKF